SPAGLRSSRVLRISPTLAGSSGRLSVNRFIRSKTLESFTMPSSWIRQLLGSQTLAVSLPGSREHDNTWRGRNLGACVLAVPLRTGLVRIVIDVISVAGAADRFRAHDFGHFPAPLIHRERARGDLF